jgi:sugar phosphate isomerase/epimerase
MNEQSDYTRRQFLRGTGAAASVAVGSVLRARRILAADSKLALPPVAVFSKVYQELKLDFEQSAAITAEAGCDGIDCTVRPGGEIAPEHAVDKMPRYDEALAKRGVRMLLVTSGILGVDSPHARDILTTTKKLGIRFYRLGFWSHEKGVARDKRVAEVKARMKDLAALNRELGLCGLFQNHSFAGKEAGYVGGDLNELESLMQDFNPAEIGVAFDLGHAIIMHGDKWPERFERLKNHIQVVYIKDMKRPSQFVPFGEGEFSHTDFFARLVKMNYRNPLSIHIEYDWSAHGKRNQPALAGVLKNNRELVGQWWERGQMG